MAKSSFDPAKTRALALIGHRGTGKTTLADLLLHTTGVTRQRGSIREGTSLLDYDEEEIRTRSGLQPAFAWIPFADHILHLVDLPGGPAGAADRLVALAAVDLAVLVCSAVEGVDIGTEQVLEELDGLSLPRVVVVNKCDLGRHPDRIVEDLAAVTVARPVALQVPFFDEHDGSFAGVVQLLDDRVLRFDLEGTGRWSPEPVPERIAAEVAAAWERLVEAVALTDDLLLEQYLEFLELPREMVVPALASAVAAGRLAPVLFASADKGIGAEPLLAAIIENFPPAAYRTPGPALAADGLEHDRIEGFVARLVARVHDSEGQPFAVLRVVSGELPRRVVNANTGLEAKVHKAYQVRGPRRCLAFDQGPGAFVGVWDPLPGRPGDTFTEGLRAILRGPDLPDPQVPLAFRPADGVEPRVLEQALAKLLDFDAGIEVVVEPTSGALVVSAPSGPDLERAAQFLRRRLAVTPQTGPAPVAYREVPTAPVDQVEHILEELDSDGEVVAYAKVAVAISPREDLEISFSDEVSSDWDLPPRFRPSVGQGVLEGLGHGTLAGYPVVGIDVRLVAAAYDMVCSTDEHFVAAAAAAVRLALAASKPRILEPWWRLHIEVIGEPAGVLSEIAQARGLIEGVEPDGRRHLIEATLAYRELRGLGARLQAIPSVRARFRADPDHYEPLPVNLLHEALQDGVPAADHATTRRRKAS